MIDKLLEKEMKLIDKVGERNELRSNFNYYDLDEIESAIISQSKKLVSTIVLSFLVLSLTIIFDTRVSVENGYATKPDGRIVKLTPIRIESGNFEL